jgi:hypothetical protein
MATVVVASSADLSGMEPQVHRSPGFGHREERWFHSSIVHTQVPERRCFRKPMFVYFGVLKINYLLQLPCVPVLGGSLICRRFGKQLM